MARAFYAASAFNADIGDWDVSKVTNMERAFAFATTFDQHLGDWDVDPVTDMSSMFYGLDIECPSWAVGKGAGCARA